MKEIVLKCPSQIGTKKPIESKRSNIKCLDEMLRHVAGASTK
jgi:hypothetical protein